jgi:hypothetical protein
MGWWSLDLSGSESSLGSCIGGGRFVVLSLADELKGERPELRAGSRLDEPVGERLSTVLRLLSLLSMLLSY